MREGLPGRRMLTGMPMWRIDRITDASAQPPMYQIKYNSAPGQIRGLTEIHRFDI